jgi:hypothetical protein
MNNKKVLLIISLLLLLGFFINVVHSDVKSDTLFNLYILNGSKLCLEDSIGRNITLTVLSGVINSSNAITNFQTQYGEYYNGGMLYFTSNNLVTLLLEYSVIGITIWINGVRTDFIYGDNFTLNPYDSMLMEWNPQYALPEMLSIEYTNTILNYMVMFVLLFIPSLFVGIELHKWKLGIIGFLGTLNVVTFIALGIGLMPLYFLFIMILIDIIMILALLKMRGSTQ